jgi:hypothetical protein
MADLERCRRFDEFNKEYTTSIVIKEGAFAKVYRTEKRDRKSGESPVVLAARLCTAKAVSDINIWASELHIHNTIKMHPNIITLFDAFIMYENGNPSASGILFCVGVGHEGSEVTYTLLRPCSRCGEGSLDERSAL